MSIKRGGCGKTRATSGGSCSIPRLGGFRDDIRDRSGSTWKAQKRDSRTVRKVYGSSTGNEEYDRRPIEQMRNEAVETTSPKRLISGIAEGCDSA